MSMRKIVLLLLITLLTPALSTAQEIDFLWQGEGYTPPFYKGRTLWSNQSILRVYAVPNISPTTDNSTLFYKWSRNGKVLGGNGGLNGIGKNTLTLTDSILGNPQTIKLEVLAPDGAILATKSQTFISQPTELLIYEDHPLYGYMFQEEIGPTFDIRESETTLAAFPLFYNILTRFSTTINYGWRNGGGDAEVTPSVTYRAPQGTSGSASVSILVKNKTDITQTNNRGVLIQFGQQ
jgi:hypothetical protein